MNADASQGALPWPWFVGIYGAVVAVCAVVWLVDAWQRMHRADTLDVSAAGEPTPVEPVEPHSCPECDRAREIAQSRLRAWFAERARVEWTDADDEQLHEYARSHGGA